MPLLSQALKTTPASIPIRPLQLFAIQSIVVLARMDRHGNRGALKRCEEKKERKTLKRVLRYGYE
jgi:hypothetical protein